MSIISAEKLSETFGIKYQRFDFRYLEEDGWHKVPAYRFWLGDKKGEKVIKMVIEEGQDKVHLWEIIVKNGYRSTIDFENVTKVKYFPDYRKVEFTSEGSNFISKLSLWWRGQFDISVWGK